MPPVNTIIYVWHFLFLANAYAKPLEKTHDKIFLFKFFIIQVVGSGIILAVI
jgi:hypothetical protein